MLWLDFRIKCCTIRSLCKGYSFNLITSIWNMYQLIYVHVSQGSLKSYVQILNPISTLHVHISPSMDLFDIIKVWWYCHCTYIILLIRGKQFIAFPVICFNQESLLTIQIWQIRRKYPMMNLVGKLLNILTWWRKILMCFLTGDASSIFQIFFIPGEWLFYLRQCYS